MSTVVSLRLSDAQIERLRRAARQLGRRPSEAAALLLEEALREREFAMIEFRDSPAGRQAYLKGSRLAVWQVAGLAQSLDGAAQVAALLEIPEPMAAAALAYARAYPDEIQAAIDDNAHAAATLQNLVPGMQTIELDAAAP